MPHASLRPFSACAMALLALTACGLTVTEPEVAVGISLTSRTAVRDSLGFAEIGFQLTNAGTAAVYLPRCGAAVSADVEQQTPTRWALASQSTLACYSSLALGPYRLEPGRSVTSRQRAKVSAGTFRIRVPVSADSLQRRTVTIASDPISVS